MAFLRKCIMCKTKFLQKEKDLVVCPRCYKRICSEKLRGSAINKRLALYNLTRKEYLLLTKSCEVCGRKEFVVIRNIVPLKKGGFDGFENYVGLCQDCRLMIKLRGVPLSKLLWCRGKTIFGVRNRLKQARKEIGKEAQFGL